jgi:uncharacterized protein YecE (DUF72 family)
MKLLVGTSGFSYKEWKGAFYPKDLPAGEMLRYYSERLPAVEINNTFYRLPKRAVLESWASQVPEPFRFVIKASRRITHFKLLKNADREMEFLLKNTAVLGDKLGVLLFQVHPKLRKDADRLGAFLDLLPEGTSGTFEFQNSSWHDEEIHEMLRKRNLALCISDRGEEREIVSTADWGYLRLRRPGYTDEDLAAWAGRIRAQGWKRAYVFVKHEDAGAGPGMAARIAELVDDG